MIIEFLEGSRGHIMGLPGEVVGRRPAQHGIVLEDGRESLLDCSRSQFKGDDDDGARQR
jgi:hypothetical protein